MLHLHDYCPKFINQRDSLFSRLNLLIIEFFRLENEYAGAICNTTSFFEGIYF
jgi:hypothetical protein